MKCEGKYEKRKEGFASLFIKLLLRNLTASIVYKNLQKLNQNVSRWYFLIMLFRERGEIYFEGGGRCP